jgi:hypothetical protein
MVHGETTATKSLLKLHLPKEKKKEEEEGAQFLARVH